MTMIALEQARQHLETLGLKQAVEVLDNTLDAAANKQLTYADVLAQLLGAEVAVRKERYLTTKTRMAHLPFQRTLEQFDFGFQPSTNGKSRNWPTWPLYPRPPTSCSWDRPVWARHTWPWHWLSRPSSGDKGPTSSVPTT